MSSHVNNSFCWSPNFRFSGFSRRETFHFRFPFRIFIPALSVANLGSLNRTFGPLIDPALNE
jgi:hypothetical protein